MMGISLNYNNCESFDELLFIIRLLGTGVAINSYYNT